MANDKIAGFAFEKSKEIDKAIYSLSHFFILKKYRMNGLVTAAAKQLFNLYKGNWELYQLEMNIPAQKFWIKVISDITAGNFKDKLKNRRRYQFFSV